MESCQLELTTKVFKVKVLAVADSDGVMFLDVLKR